jgi:hypothetical protein
MLSFIPHSVSRNRAGFVRNPAAGWSINVPQWIPAPKKPAVDMAAVDRVVDTLTRFVATWVVQSRTARSAARVREAGERWTRAAMSPSWASMMEHEDRVQAAAARREFARCVDMPEAQWKAQCRADIAAASDVGSLMLAWVPIWAARDANVARNLVQYTQIWNEVALHNRQMPAQRRVARVTRNHFAIDSDSD